MDMDRLMSCGFDFSDNLFLGTRDYESLVARVSFLQKRFSRIGCANFYHDFYNTLLFYL